MGEWTDLAQHSIKCRALVYTIMNIPVHKELGNFVPNHANTASPSRFLIHQVGTALPLLVTCLKNLKLSNAGNLKISGKESRKCSHWLQCFISFQCLFIFFRLNNSPNIMAHRIYIYFCNTFNHSSHIITTYTTCCKI